MPRPVKSQWDFGELFPIDQTTRKVLSVSDLTWQIRRLLEQQIGRVWVTGEITNLKTQSSGHIYFVLKDASAQINCILFRSEIDVDRSLLQDGRKVLLQGEITVYEARGQYQLRVTAIELQGIGALQIAFEKLKQKLNAEGLFAKDRKRSLPKFPQRIGLITSPTGAAIRDILHVISRRNRSLEIILAPCRVQGDGAGAEIAAAIRLLNEFHLSQPSTKNQTGALDLILLARGGGSLEDLWAFNEEPVARAIFHSELPVVSAVGHEIDFTISDFVADFRAATPSAAAEIITEGVFSRCQFINLAAGQMRGLVDKQLESKAQTYKRLLQRLSRYYPRKRLNEWLQRLDDLLSSATRCAKQGVRRELVVWKTLCDRLARVRPALLLKQRREQLRLREQRLREKARHRLNLNRDSLTSLEARLRLLGPEQVLARGYSITLDATTGKAITNENQTRPSQRLKTRLKSGQITSTVDK